MDHPAPLEDDPVIDSYRAAIDVTLIRRNLALSVEERFLQLMAMQRYAEEPNRSATKLRAAAERVTVSRIDDDDRSPSCR